MQSYWIEISFWLKNIWLSSEARESVAWLLFDYFLDAIAFLAFGGKLVSKPLFHLILKWKSSHYFVFCIANSVINIFVSIKIYIIRLSSIHLEPLFAHIRLLVLFIFQLKPMKGLLLCKINNELKSWNQGLTGIPWHHVYV